MRAAVEAGALEAVGIDLFGLQQLCDGIGQLDLTAGAAAGLLQQVEDLRAQHVATNHRQITGGILRLRLLHDLRNAALAAVERLGGDNAVAGSLVVRHVLDRDHARTAGLVEIGHLLQRALATVPDQVIRQQHGERLVADHCPGAQHRMAQAQRFGLGHEHRTHALGQHVADHFQLFLLAGALELLLQLVSLVEIVRDRVLVAVGDEHQGVAPGLDRLIDGVLDQRAIDDRQHLLGNGLGGRQEARTETCDRKNRLANASGHQFLPASLGNGTILVFVLAPFVSRIGEYSGMTADRMACMASAS